MFEAVELGHKLAKAKFNIELPKLRSKLLAAHFALRGQKFPVIVIISGADAAGKGAVVHRLNEWLDPRGVETHAFWQASDEERERPHRHLFRLLVQRADRPPRLRRERQQPARHGPRPHRGF
jgi:polyphosphate kinase 2 (PPK2 family)